MQGNKSADSAADAHSDFAANPVASLDGPAADAEGAANSAIPANVGCMEGETWAEAW